MDVPLSVIGAEVGKHLSRGDDARDAGGVRALLPLRLVCREWRDLATLGAASAELDLDVEVGEEDEEDEEASGGRQQRLRAAPSAPQLPAAVVAASVLFAAAAPSSSSSSSSLSNNPASMAPSSAIPTTAAAPVAAVGAPPPLLLLHQQQQQQQQGQQQQAAAVLATTTQAAPAPATSSSSPSRSSSTASFSSSSSSQPNQNYHPHELSRRPRHPIDALARRCPRLESLALHVGPRVTTEQLARALERAGRAFPQLTAVAVLFNDASTTLRREDVARLVRALHVGTTSGGNGHGNGNGSGNGTSSSSRLRALAVRAAFAPDDADVFGGLAALASASASSSCSDSFYPHHSASPPPSPTLLLPRLEELRLLSGDPAVAPAAGGGLTDEHVRSLAAALGANGANGGNGSAALRVLEFPGHARLFTGATLALLAPACPRLEALAVTPARAAPAFFAYERHAPCRRRSGGGNGNAKRASSSFFAPSVLAPGGAASGVPVGIVGQADYTLSSDAALDALAALVVARGGGAGSSSPSSPSSPSAAAAACALAAPTLDLEVGVPDARWAAALLARVDALHRMQLEQQQQVGAAVVAPFSSSSAPPPPPPPLRLCAHVREPADGGAIAALCAAPGAAEGALVALSLESRGAPTREDVAALGRLRGLERLALQCVRCSGGVAGAGGGGGGAAAAAAAAAPAGGGLGAALSGGGGGGGNNNNNNNASSSPSAAASSSSNQPTPLLDVLPGVWSGLSRLRALHLSVNPAWRAPLTPAAVRAAAEAWPELEALHLRLGCADAIGDGARAAGGVERALAGFGRLRALSLSWLGGEGSLAAAAAAQAAHAAAAQAAAAQAAAAAAAAAAAQAAQASSSSGSSSSSSSSGNNDDDDSSASLQEAAAAAAAASKKKAAAMAAATAAAAAARPASPSAAAAAASLSPATATPPQLASSWPPRSGPAAAGAALLHRHAASALSRGLRRRSLDAMHGAGGSPVALNVAALPETLEELALTSIHAVRLGVVATAASTGATGAAAAVPPSVALLPSLRRLSVDGHFCVGDDTLEALVAGIAVQVGGDEAVAAVGGGAGGASAAPAAASARHRSSLEHLALTLVGRQPLTSRGLQRALGGGGGASLRSLLVHDYRDGALAMDQRCVAAGARVGGGLGSSSAASLSALAAATTTTTLAAALPRLRALRLSTPDVVHAALVPGCYSGYGRLRRLDLVGSQEQAAASLSGALPLCCMRARNGAQAVAAAQAATAAAQAAAAAAAQAAAEQQQQQQQQAVAVPA